MYGNVRLSAWSACVCVCVCVLSSSCVALTLCLTSICRAVLSFTICLMRCYLCDLCFLFVCFSMVSVLSIFIFPVVACFLDSFLLILN